MPPRLVLPDEQKGMVPVTFIPPVTQQTAQTGAGQAPQQTTSTSSNQRQPNRLNHQDNHNRVSISEQGNVICQRLWLGNYVIDGSGFCIYPNS